MWTWFLTTRIGRALLALAGVLSALGVAYLKGRSDQKVNQKLDTVKQVEEVRKRENEIESLNHDGIVERASRWVRD